MAKKKRNVVKQKIGIARLYDTKNNAEGFFRRQKKKGYRVFSFSGISSYALISAKRKPTKLDLQGVGPGLGSMHEQMYEVKKEEDIKF